MTEYLRDWNDACAYARECLPPDLFIEPFTFFLFVGATTCAIYLWNERR